MQKCPICDSELENKVDGIDGGVVSEERTWCKNGCYDEEFQYGHTTITIFGERDFREVYNDTTERRKQTKKELDEEIAYWLNDFKYLTKLMDDTKEHNMSSYTIVEKFGVGYVNKNAIAKWEI